MSETNQPDQTNEGKTPQADEPILDLTETIDNAQDAAGPDAEVDPLAATVELEESLEEDYDDDQDDDDDFVDSLGMEIGAEDDDDDLVETQDLFQQPSDSDPAAMLDVSPEQLDAALERVIQKMFYDRIDRILVTVIEKRVKGEIDRIKTILLDETADDN